MKQLTKYFVILGLFLGFQSCKKDEPSPFPEIEFVSISQTQVAEFENQLEVIISYSDVNGDLGTVNADDLTLRVKDSRLGDFDWYHVPPLTPNSEEIEIQGVFSVQLNPLFLLGNGVEESTNFTLQLKDRAENWSNQITTPTVIIRDSL
tara:strand:+ start:3323 stop:3769 length:447 start_codon:yes stop_codon:yes gene_type:complete